MSLCSTLIAIVACCIFAILPAGCVQKSNTPIAPTAKLTDEPNNSTKDVQPTYSQITVNSQTPPPVPQISAVTDKAIHIARTEMKQDTYNPASPKIYFSIGNVISAIALFLALTQLIKPIIEFRLSIGFFRKNRLYILFLIAILFVFIAAILPFIPGTALPFLGYPVFWEIIAGSLFVFGAIMFLWKVSRPVKFNKRNYKFYLEYCTSIIAKGDENDFRILSNDEIYSSIKNVIKACNEYNRHNDLINKNETSEYTKCALRLLDVWSDEKLCQIIVCYVPGTATEIFQQIKEQRLYFSGGYSLVQQLVRQAFLNKNSILYREEDYFGLGHFKTFTNLLFGDCELVESGFRLLQAWNHWDDNLETWKVKKYMEVLKVSTKAHIASGCGKGHRPSLSCGFDVAANIAQSQCWRLDKLSDKEVYDSPLYKNLCEIAWGLKRIIELLSESENNIKEHRFDEKTYNYLNDGSIYGIVAKGIYDLLESLSTAYSKDEDIRMLAITLWMEVYPVSKSQESKTIVEVQKRLNIHLLKKFEDNLKELYYPALTRLWINLIGLQVTREECGANFVNTKLFELLRKYYENAVKTDPKKARDMLPDKVRYDEEKGHLIQKWAFGEETVFDLRHE
ncbi:MAG TPA: hypothetical protein DD726_00105 [Phycisphaerales bacterium]|nr:hypothetical protein [Phycisphaerales bacterium]